MLGQFGAILYALGLKLFTTETTAIDTPDAILALAQERWEAKKAKDFERADALRDQLLKEGWIIKDTTDGFKVEMK